MATSKTKKISLLQQMDVRKAKNAKPGYGVGGPASNNPNKPDTIETTNPTTEKLGGAASRAAGMMPNYSSAESTDQQSVAGTAGKYALEGASMGSALGPWGMAIGAVGGAVVGGIESTQHNANAKEINEKQLASNKQSLKMNSIYSSDAGYAQYEKGGSIGKNISNQSELDNPVKSNKSLFSSMSYYDGGDVTDPALATKKISEDTSANSPKKNVQHVMYQMSILDGKKDYVKATVTRDANKPIPPAGNLTGVEGNVAVSEQEYNDNVKYGAGVIAPTIQRYHANGGQVKKAYKKGGEITLGRYGDDRDFELNTNNSNNYNNGGQYGGSGHSSDGGSNGSNYAEGGSTDGSLAKINDAGKGMVTKAPSLMHWMKPGYMPAAATFANGGETWQERAPGIHHINDRFEKYAEGGETVGKYKGLVSVGGANYGMMEGGPMYHNQAIINKTVDTKAPIMNYTLPNVKPNRSEGGVSRAPEGTGYMNGGQTQGGFTYPRLSEVDSHQRNYKDGGSSEEYGVVPGNGNPKADDKNLSADNGGFVAPVETADKAKELLAMAGYNPNKKLAMNKGGKVPIKISSHEVYMSPDVKEDVKEATGMSDKDFERELSPNSPYNKHAHYAEGSMVKPDYATDPNFKNKNIDFKIDPYVKPNSGTYKFGFPLNLNKEANQIQGLVGGGIYKGNLSAQGSIFGMSMPKDKVNIAVPEIAAAYQSGRNQFHAGVQVPIVNTPNATKVEQPGFNIGYKRTFADGGKINPTSMTENFHRYHSKHYTGGGNMGYAVGGGIDKGDGTSYFKTDEDGNVITPEMDQKMNLLNMSMAKEYKDREDQAAWDDMNARGLANTGKEQYVPNPNDPQSLYEKSLTDEIGYKKSSSPVGPVYDAAEDGEKPPVKKAPVTPADDYYKDIEKANKRLTIGGEALTLGKLMWDAAQKYKAMPTSKVAPFLAYERNWSDMEGSMRRDLAQSEATQRRAAKEQGIQSIFNQMASGSDLEGRLKISETIGDKIQQSKSEYADKKQAYETGKAEIESRDALRNAMGAAEFAAQKGQTLGADMGSIYNVAKSGVDTKLAIGAMKGTEAYQLKMNQLYRTATNPYATKADKDKAKAKLKEIGVDIESSGVIVDTPGQKSKDNTAQNIGEGE